MSNPVWLNKYLTMKPEVKQIFNDLDAWLNYCRFNLIKYDPADLYKSVEYRTWQEKRQRKQQQQRQNREYRARNQAQQ
jgi:hypothetical protein